jgi:hypothetical protein
MVKDGAAWAAENAQARARSCMLLLARRHCGGVVYTLSHARARYGWARSSDRSLQLCEGQMVLNVLGLRSWFKPPHGIGYFRAGY